VRERVEQIGGTLAIKTAANRGSAADAGGGDGLADGAFDPGSDLVFVLPICSKKSDNVDNREFGKAERAGHHRDDQPFAWGE
jgi:hypothetical protein